MTQIPVINMVATGQNITRLRKQAGLSVANLQQIFGFTTPQAIYKWQRGTALPTVDNLVILAAVFNTNINNIFTLKTEEDFAFGTCFTLFHTFHYDSVYVDFGGFSAISFMEKSTGNQITFDGVKYVQLVSANALRIVCKDFFNPNEEAKFIMNYE